MTHQEGTLTIPGNKHVTAVENKYVTGEKKFQEIFERANLKQVFCPVRDIIARVSDKWSILAIYALGGYGTLRFNEMKYKIGDVSQRMLTVTLRNLEADGLVTRKVYPEVPPRVEYQLTPWGYALMEQFADFADWANEHGTDIVKHRKKFREPRR
jgi:DNA-binding HxlR family transcriptional regulator